jgi:hypothetical protein
MPHELYRSDDGKYAMMYNEKVPWHGLGQKLEELPTAEEGLKAAGLDWRVAKRPLFYFFSPGDMGTVPDHYAIVPGEGWKDRGPKKGKPGRTLLKSDIVHYQKIIVALSETIRIMAKIDEIIEAHGGWPGAFAAKGASKRTTRK